MTAQAFERILLHGDERPTLDPAGVTLRLRHAPGRDYDIAGRRFRPASERFADFGSTSLGDPAQGLTVPVG